MKTGSLMDCRTSKNVSYSYCHRGLDVPFRPDRIRELQERDVYTKEDGSLFYGLEVAWKDSSVVLDSVDIRISFGERCFADHILLCQGEGSCLDGVEVFTLENGKMRKIGYFAPQSQAMVTDAQISIPVGYDCDNLTVRLNGNCKPIRIKKLDVLGAWEMEDTLWPTPLKAKYEGGHFPLENLPPVVAEGEDGTFAAGYLLEKLREDMGKDCGRQDCEGQDCEGKDCGRIVFETDKAMAGDSYRVDVLRDEVRVRASGRRGLLYGADALLGLLDGDGFRCCHIEDAPFMDVRGVHLTLPDKKEIPFFRKLVRYILVPMRYNVVYLEFGGSMRYDRFPEINEACRKHEGKDILEKDEVREIFEYMVSHGLEVVPLVPSFGHVQFITRAYPWLGERSAVLKEDGSIDVNTADVRPEGSAYHTMCPKHPDYYKVIFGLIDEIVEVVKPERYVHLGHDEIYDLGKCPVCSKIPRGELFAEEINTLNDYVRKKGYTSIIWADMLQTLEYSAPTAIEKVSKDILMMDFIWYFYDREEPEDRLLDHGFSVIMGNMYSSHYTNYEARIRKKGMLGAQVSLWTAWGEKPIAFKGKLYELVYSAEMMWSGSYRSDMRLSYNEAVKPVLKKARMRIGGLCQGGQEKKIPIPGSSENIPYDIRGIVPYQGAASVDRDAPSADIPVGEYAKEITFLHAVDRSTPRLLWKGPTKIGDYTVVYEDGSEYREDIYDMGNIHKYLSVYGDRIQSRFFRHEGYTGTWFVFPEGGKTAGGDDYTLGRYSIPNPFPEKKISKITLNHHQNTDARILLFELALTLCP